MKKLIGCILLCGLCLSAGCVLSRHKHEPAPSREMEMDYDSIWKLCEAGLASKRKKRRS